MNEELNNILVKVRSLYLKYGIKSITMDDVSRELGISKKTLYQYVTDKTDLVEKVIELERNYRKCEFDQLLQDKVNAIEELIGVHKFVYKRMKESNPSTEYDLKKYYPEIFQKFSEERQKAIYERVKENLIKGKAQGIYRSELNEEIISKILLVRTETLHSEHLFDFSEFTSPEFFTEVMIYHIHGIANEKGIGILNSNMEKLMNPSL